MPIDTQTIIQALVKAKSGFCSFLTWYDDRTVRNRSEFFKKLHARKPVDSASRRDVRRTARTD